MPPNRFCILCGINVESVAQKWVPKQKKGYMYNDYEGIDTWEGPRGYWGWGWGFSLLSDAFAWGCSGCLFQMFVFGSFCFGVFFVVAR